MCTNVRMSVCQKSYLRKLEHDQRAIPENDYRYSADKENYLLGKRTLRFGWPKGLFLMLGTPFLS